VEKKVIERLIDSVILIDHLNRVDQAKQFIIGLNPEETAISVITRAEILVGIEEDSEPLVKAFLDQYHLFPIDREIADLAAALRRKHGWRLPDAFQAALCLHHGLRFSTRNTKDFNPRKHSFVEIPYTV
jgi:predicted nucleic acid-binding protein